jgi:hypothetical protein
LRTRIVVLLVAAGIVGLVIGARFLPLAPDAPVPQSVSAYVEEAREVSRRAAGPLGWILKLRFVEARCRPSSTGAIVTFEAAFPPVRTHAFISFGIPASVDDPSGSKTLIFSVSDGQLADANGLVAYVAC